MAVMREGGEKIKPVLGSNLSVCPHVWPSVQQGRTSGRWLKIGYLLTAHAHTHMLADTQTMSHIYMHSNLVTQWQPQRTGGFMKLSDISQSALIQLYKQWKGRSVLYKILHSTFTGGDGNGKAWMSYHECLVKVMVWKIKLNTINFECNHSIL